MRIVTVTVNPCIDKSTTIAALLPEKKLRCTKPILEPGGGGINVARAITKLGGDATAVYLSGGYNGNLIKRLLEQENVRAVPVPIQNDTRENTVVLDTAANMQYRFCMPGPEVGTDEWKNCLRILDAITDVDYLIASGSLPPGLPADFFASLARHAKNNNVKMVVDASGIALKNALEEGVYLWKPNLAELCEYACTDYVSIDTAADICKAIINANKCEIVLLSMGEAGALLVTRQLVKHILPPPAERKSTVGAGDSMTAGMILSLAKGMEIFNAARYAVASGTAATMNSGTQLCRLRDVEMLYAHMQGG